MPIGMYRSYKGLPNAQERAEGRAFLKKKVTDFAMSKPVGKVLDSKVGKVGVKVGNAVIKGVKSLKPNMKKITDDLFGSPEKDKMQMEQGKKLNADYSGFKYGVQLKKK